MVHVTVGCGSHPGTVAGFCMHQAGIDAAAFADCSRHELGRSPDGKVADVLPGPDSGFNARTRVHEYGGGESIVADGAIYWSNFK